ncbi:MAG: hypothetical protein ACQERZ_05650 [Fusobacteriota bacterium]
MEKKKLKRIGIIILIFVFGIGCLKDKKMRVKVESNENFEIDYIDKDYQAGDILELDLHLKEDNLDSIGFDINLNKKKFKLINVIKNDFTTNANFVASKPIEDGYHIMFSDFEKKLQTTSNFAKINLRVTWSGEEEILVENIVKN